MCKNSSLEIKKKLILVAQLIEKGKIANKSPLVEGPVCNNKW